MKSRSITGSRLLRSGSARGPGALDDLALLHELWLISHFGWITTTILRSLMIASGHELAAAALAERWELRQLGWLEERPFDADPAAGRRRPG